MPKLQQKKNSHLHPLTQHNFWSGIGYIAYNTFCDQWVSGACLEVMWRFELRTFYIGTPSGDKKSLALDELNRFLFLSNPNTTSKRAPWVERFNCMQNNQWKIIRDQLQLRISFCLSFHLFINIAKLVSDDWMGLKCSGSRCPWRVGGLLAIQFMDGARPGRPIPLPDWPYWILQGV